MQKKSQLTDVETLRRNARAHVDNGAVTADYSADRTEVSSC